MSMSARKLLALAAGVQYHRRVTQTLSRRIGFWSAVAILVGTTIGSGIFRSPASIANRLPQPWALIAVWVAGGVLALCGALTLAELASEAPETGGLYVFIRDGWGRLPAFLFGWAELTLLRAAALGAIAMTFAEYAMRAVGRDPAIEPYRGRVHYLAAAAILVTGWLNYRGVRWGTLLQNALTVTKCLGLLALVALALTIGGGAGGAHSAALVTSPAASSVASFITLPGTITPTAFGLALLSVLWVYDGWADVSFVAGEVQDPERNLPRVLIFGTVAVIVIYVLANVAYLTVVPIQELRHSPLIAADVAERLLGAWGRIAIGVVVALSTFGGLNGSMLTGPRVLWAVANDGLLFRRLGSVHPRYGTPHVAIAVASVLGVVFVSFQTFEQLADAFVTVILPFYALAVAAVFPLRRRRRRLMMVQQSGHLSDPVRQSATGCMTPRSSKFRTPGYPVVPALFVLATIALLMSALADASSRIPTLAAFLIVLAGIPVYRVLQRRA